MLAQNAHVSKHSLYFPKTVKDLHWISILEAVSCFEHWKLPKKWEVLENNFAAAADHNHTSPLWLRPNYTVKFGFPICRWYISQKLSICFKIEVFRTAPFYLHWYYENKLFSQNKRSQEKSPQRCSQQGRVAACWAWSSLDSPLFFLWTIPTPDSFSATLPSSRKKKRKKEKNQSINQSLMD